METLPKKSGTKFYHLQGRNWTILLRLAFKAEKNTCRNNSLKS